MLDIKDTKTQNKIKSMHLTCSKYPNIIQQAKFNSSERNGNTLIKQEELEKASKECELRGYIQKDLNIDFKGLIEKSREKVDRSYPKEMIQTFHPFTVIITEGKQPKIIKTNQVTEEGWQVIKNC